MLPVVLYVDDVLNSDKISFEKMLVYQLEYALRKKCRIVGKDPSSALVYLEENTGIDLLIMDHNLWWPPGSEFYEFRFGYQFVQELYNRGYDVPPIFILTDSVFAGSMWKSQDVPYARHILKGNPDITCENVLNAIIEELGF